MSNTHQHLTIPYDLPTDEYLDQLQDKHANAYSSPKHRELTLPESPQAQKTPGAAHYITPRNKTKFVKEEQDSNGRYHTPERVNEGHVSTFARRHESFFKRPDKNGTNCMGSSGKRNY